MACRQLDETQRRTLHEMGIHHPHPSVRQRAQALQQLARGETLAAVAASFGKTGVKDRGQVLQSRIVNKSFEMCERES